MTMDGVLRRKTCSVAKPFFTIRDGRLDEVICTSSQKENDEVDWDKWFADESWNNYTRRRRLVRWV
jgi:hypothetical protein